MELWHVLNRGVDKRTIFLDSHDYMRFIHNLYEFNDTAPAKELIRRSVGPTRSHTREKLVDIHGWCLMENHYHLLLSECVEGGITKFMMKMNVGYAKYFNERYDREGTLFQGRTKKVLVSEHAHFLHILHYVHLNPLDYLKSSHGWRLRDKGSIQSVPTALEYLAKYRWSSYLDYCAKKNFPSILTTSLFKNRDVFKNYETEVVRYLKEIELSSLTGLTLE